MDHSSEQPKFEIKPAIEQRPFESPSVQSFFHKWCEINDSIDPQIVDRQTWEQRSAGGVLQDREDGKKTLLLPKDLQLWEMVGVMEVVDHDTFSTKPERQNEKKDKLVDLGKLFQNSGAYIAERLDFIDQGKEIARALAEEFYDYGLSLENGKRPEQPPTLDSILSRTLTSKEIEEVDHFLAGDNLYKARQLQVEKLSMSDPTKREELYESERQRTLAQFFRTAQKAFELEQKTENDELETATSSLKPWQSNAPIHSAFLAKTMRAITKEVETPKRELVSAIFRRGLEKLLSEMKDPGRKNINDSCLELLGMIAKYEQKKITDVLNVTQLRNELENIRQTGDINKTSDKEREIADKIQNIISNLPYHEYASNPAEMVANQYINCVGASTLGGALMKEVGLNYLVGGIPNHSILFLVTTDDHVEWRDMRNATLNEDLSDGIMVGKKQNGSPLTVVDIVNFSRNPKPEGLMFDIESHEYRNKMPWVEEGQRRFVAIFEPEHGQQIQILNSVGNVLRSLGRNEEAIEAYKQAIATCPKDADPYNGLGNVLRSLGRNEEAIEAFRQAIGVDSNYATPYNGLGNTLQSLGRNEEAIEAYKQAISMDPKYTHLYNGLGNTLRSLGRNEEAIEAYKQAIVVDSNYTTPYNGLGNVLRSLGRNEEAIEAYRKFIDLENRSEKDYWIKRAEKIIAELQNK